MKFLRSKERAAVVGARRHVDAVVLVLDGQHQPQRRQRVGEKLDLDVPPRNLDEDADGDQHDEKDESVALCAGDRAPVMEKIGKARQHIKERRRVNRVCAPAPAVLERVVVIIDPARQRVHQNHKLREKERKRVKREPPVGYLPRVAADEQNVISEHRRQGIVEDIGNEPGRICKQMRFRPEFSLEKRDDDAAGRAEHHVQQQKNINLVLPPRDATLDQRIAKAGNAEQKGADIKG